jgi:hypothetical protein
MSVAAMAFFHPRMKQSRDKEQHSRGQTYKDSWPDLLPPFGFEARHKRPF